MVQSRLSVGPPVADSITATGKREGKMPARFGF